ncbi:hypothetical protein C8Q78DRAFT_1077067 [Trametes maxima]|nr:hypothetical protein C8Q78DRAFT_1077067 [Trametes maxima]
MDIVHFMSEPAVLLRFGLNHPISLSTAQRWMHALDYRWTKTPSGQFVDGHEREDVVKYRQEQFLPAMAEYDLRARQWNQAGEEVPLDLPPEQPTPTGTEPEAGTESRHRQRRVVYWWHDESTFYAHDRRQRRWVHKREKAVPRKKGEGASLMVADFVSAEYGWLRSPDGKESARKLFRAGKNRDGYFTYEEILEHATAAMDILEKHYPEDEHVLIFDNAPTHLKRAPDALSARKMSMGPTREGKPVFGVERSVVDINGRPVYAPDGAIRKEKVPMADARFKDGTPQSLYFPQGHPRAGAFKGMAILLQERGYDTTGLRAQCNKDFKCRPPALNCCCRRLLYNEPDFQDVESLLEIQCRRRGFPILFLPKFHSSSSEADLERNVVSALDQVPMVVIRRFYTRSHRFMDAYRRGLDGKQAAWAAKKYHSHRVLPNAILDDLEREGITPQNR